MKRSLQQPQTLRAHGVERQAGVTDSVLVGLGASPSARATAQASKIQNITTSKQARSYDRQ